MSFVAIAKIDLWNLQEFCLVNWRDFCRHFVGQTYGISSGKQAYSLIAFVDTNECANFSEANGIHKVRLFDKILDSNKLANSTGTLAEISVELSPDWEPTIQRIIRWKDDIIARFGPWNQIFICKIYLIKIKLKYNLIRICLEKIY